jgi:hypothetical protein
MPFMSVQTKMQNGDVCLFAYLVSEITNLNHSLMEVSPSWEAATCAPTQELPSILWNPNIHYRVHKSPPLVPILNQINPIHTIPSNPISLRSILILSTHLRLGLTSGLFPSGFPPLPHSCYMPSPSHPPWLDHSNCTWRRVQVMKLLLMQFSRTSSHFISLREPESVSKYSEGLRAGRRGFDSRQR